MSTTPSTREHLTLVNPDAESLTIGIAVMSMISAQAANRHPLAKAITSIQWDEGRGVGVLVRDAGARQHLAACLGFEKTITQHRTQFGMGAKRQGHMLGIPVTVWNIEP